jgi:hypothetical protein
MTMQDSGRYVPSFVSFCYSNLDENEDLARQEYLIKGSAAALYTAGVDTVRFYLKLSFSISLNSSP